MNDKIIHINSSDFESEVLKSTKPVIVDYYSDECPPCEVLAPIYEKMATIYGDYIKFVKIYRQENKEFAKSLGVTGSPTVLFFNHGKEIGTRLNGYMTKPQVRIAIESILGDVIPPTEMKKVYCDVLIFGAGPAGLSAGIYAARAKMDVVIIEEGIPGGQAATTYHVANYPGTKGTVSGKEITDNMREQATSFGARIDDLKEIFEVKLIDNLKYVRTEDTEYYAKSVIIASGARPRPLTANGASDFEGHGVHYCATCDGAMYQDLKIAVIGGGSAALEEAVFLTRFASHVTIIHRRDSFRATKIEIDEAKENSKIDFLTNKVVLEVKGEGYSLTSLVLEDVHTGEISELPMDGTFVYIGNNPLSDYFKEEVETDPSGYVVASEDTKTNIPGVFAAGDIRTKAVRQIVTAASDGAVAGIMAEKYIVSSRI